MGNSRAIRHDLTEKDKLCRGSDDPKSPYSPEAPAQYPSVIGVITMRLARVNFPHIDWQNQTSVVVLLELYVLCRQQPHIMAACDQLASPIIRRAAGLDSDGLSRSLR